MATTLQITLRGISTKVDDLPEKLTNPVGDIFTKAVSAVNDFFQYLIGLFNQKYPPETRDEQIHQWLHGATPYIIAAVVLITLLCCWRCLYSCIASIVIGCFKVVQSFFRCLRRCLCCGRRSAAKMMRAPGRSPVKIRRSAFEANPRGYFRDLRGQPNNFVY